MAAEAALEEVKKSLRTIVVGSSIRNFADPNQIGWVYYREGDAIISCKVIKGKKFSFLAHPSVYRDGKITDIIYYENKTLWEEKRKCLQDHFISKFGWDYFISGNPKDLRGPDE